MSARYKIISFIQQNSNDTLNFDYVESLYKRLDVENLPKKVALALMDTTIQHSERTAIKWLQMSLPVRITMRLDKYTLKALSSKLAFDFSTENLLVDIILLRRELENVRSKNHHDNAKIKNLRKFLQEEELYNGRTIQ